MSHVSQNWEQEQGAVCFFRSSETLCVKLHGLHFHYKFIRVQRKKSD